MSAPETHRLIALIYETAIDPSRWQELLEALAEFIAELDEQQVSLQTTTSKSSCASTLLENTPSTGSLTHTLRSINHIGHQNSVDFNSADTSQILLHHFQNALKVAKRLADEAGHKDALASVLDQLPMSLLIVDVHSHIVDSNLQARTLLEQKIGIRECNGRLNTSEPQSNRQLQKLIAKIAHRAPDSPDADALLLSTHSGEQLVAYLSPVASSPESESGNVAIFLSPAKSQPLPISDTFTALYGLTPSEQDVCGLLARGLSIKEIAQHRSSTENTVRSQVKSIFSKAGVSRQTELVSLLLTSPSKKLGTDASSAALSPCSARLLRLSDGRHLAYREYGDPTGQPMVFHHSILGSSLEVGHLIDKAARKHGVRIIAPERPGFGSSDPKPGRTLLDWGGDLQQLLDALELDQVDLGGYAMGGLLAKAAAAVLPKRTHRLLLVSCGLPATTREEFAATMPLFRLNNRLARDLPALHRAFFSILRRGVLGNPSRFFRQLLSNMTPDEARYLESEAFRKQFFEAMVEGGKQGSAHMAREIELLMNGWGFDPATITTPTQIWSGEMDRHVAPILSKKLAERMPNATFLPVPDHSHFMIYDRMEDILQGFLAPDGNIADTCSGKSINSGD